MFSASVGFLWTINGLITIVAVVYVVSWSLIFDYEEATESYCGNKEFLPSISHASGDFSPQNNVWKILMTLHVGLRFVMTLMYYNWHLRVEVGRFRIIYTLLLLVAIACHLAEIMGLMMLTSVALSENGWAHEKSFLTFVGGSQIYMIISCILIAWSHHLSTTIVISREKKILRIKVFLGLFNVVIFFIALKLFYRYERYCEDYMHSYFSICEYMTVFSNIIFHLLAIHDFKNYSLAILTTEDIVSGVYKNW